MKIPFGIIIVVLVFVSLATNFVDFISAFRTESLFTGMFLLCLPIFLFVFFADTIFAGGLLYLTYHMFEEKHSGCGLPLENRTTRNARLL